MPIERRTSRTQTTTLIVSIVALAIAVVLVIGVLRAATHRSSDTVVTPSKAVFDAGVASERVASIRQDGPILFSDVAGSGQSRPIYVSHTGSDAKSGWQVIDAHPDGAKADCFLKWKPSRDLFTTTCDSRTFPADGGNQRHYKWKVTDGELLIELNAK